MNGKVVRAPSGATAFLLRRPLDPGGFRAVRIGRPSAATDLYYATMEMSWPAFIGIFSACLLLINPGPGILYALLPGNDTHPPVA
jgi:hypothetical protein